MENVPDEWTERLRTERYDVRSIDPAAAEPCGDLPDLVLIDGTDKADVVDVVRACRDCWPAPTPVLVLGVGDPRVGSAAIDAGATDAQPDSTSGPLMDAHVRRLLQTSAGLRLMLDTERRLAKQQGMAMAARDVALPLGDLLDELEAVMARAPLDERLNDLLELTARAIAAVDRVRRLAQAVEPPDGRDGTS